MTRRKQAKQLLLVENPIPIAHVKLGSLTSKPWSPVQDAFLPISLLEDRKPLLVEGEDYYVAPQIGFKNLVRMYGKTTLSTHLTQVLGFTFSSGATDQQIVDAVEGKTYQLCQPEKWFNEELCKRGETKEWLEAKRSKEDIFLVIGFRTFVDAQVKRVHKEEKQRDVKITAPIDAIVGAAGGVPVPTPLGLDSSLAVDRQLQHSEQSNFKAPEEQVYAVQVRKVKFNWYSRNKVESPFLDVHNRWESVDVMRGQLPLDAETHDIVEVNLTSVLTLAVEQKVNDEGEEDYYLIRME